MSKSKELSDLVLPWRKYSLYQLHIVIFLEADNYTSESFCMLLFVQKSPLSSDTVVGQGNTSAWKMCGLDRKTSLCLIFDIAKKDGPDSIVQSANDQFYFQFLT